MAIPATQLETWSNRSQTDTAVNAHEKIRISLKSLDFKYWYRDFDDYLQGSYANSTNIWRDHDVDVVIQLNTAFTYHISPAMSASQSTALRSAISSPPSFDLQQFHPEVVRRLREVFGWGNVEEGNKAIKVKGEPGHRLDADVVVCRQYRYYYIYTGDLNEGFNEGIAFHDQRDNRLIINYPKQHLKNGQEKNKATNGGFKKTVRVFKNARNRMIENELTPAGRAPSYFIQGLLYNVPTDQFNGGVEHDFLASLLWLAKNEHVYDSFDCQNGLQRLFGDSPEQWSRADAISFVGGLLQLWSDWS